MAQLHKEEKKAFAEWLALPKDLREPQTQYELADILGVSNVTLSHWKDDKSIWENVDRVHVRKLRERLGELFESLIQHAIDGKHPKYMEMAFQLAKEQFGQKDINVTITKTETQVMTTENLAARAYELLSRTGFKSLDQQSFVEQIANPALLVEANIVSEDTDGSEL